MFASLSSKSMLRATTQATEEQADTFIKRWPALDQDHTHLRQKCIPEFEKVISHKKTAMFFQIDRRVSRLLEAGLASPTRKTIGGVFTRFCGRR
jgi:hypothetical protein